MTHGQPEHADVVIRPSLHSSMVKLVSVRGRGRGRGRGRAGVRVSICPSLHTSMPLAAHQPPWHRLSSAPAPPQGAPGGSGWLDAPRERPAQWAPRRRLRCSSQPPPKPPISLRMTRQAQQRRAQAVPLTLALALALILTLSLTLTLTLTFTPTPTLALAPKSNPSPSPNSKQARPSRASRKHASSTRTP
jgi:hypothetical protein